MVDIPALPGSYYLHLVLAESIELQVGRLGLFHLEPGSYFYCGSALGPGGLRARINHHLAGSGKSHWHIDYLRRTASMSMVGYCVGPDRLECAWSQDLASLSSARIAVPGFGVSDCREGCQAHLIHFSAGDEPNLENRVKWGNVNIWRIS
jgi:Uri superfamily endonuclease